MNVIILNKFFFTDCLANYNSGVIYSNNCKIYAERERFAGSVLPGVSLVVLLFTHGST